MKPERYQAGIVKDRLAWVYFAEDIDPLLADLARVTQERDATFIHARDEANLLREQRRQSEARYESLVSQIRALPRFDCDGYLESTASPDGANVRWADLLALVDHP